MNGKSSLMRKKKTSFARRLDRHFLTCSAAGAAALGASSAEAGIVYHALTNANVPLSATEFLFINVDAGTFAVSNTAPLGYDLNFFALSQSDGLFQFQAAPGGGGLGFAYGGYNYISKLTNGFMVDNTGVFLTSGIMAAAQPDPNQAEWNGGVTNGYVGFEFDLNGDTRYGWARLNLNANLLNDPVATVLDFAYEDSGLGIEVGAVPEPSTLALGCLAAGAFGLTLWRRKRKQG
jgi:hypothetical protein